MKKYKLGFSVSNLLAIAIQQAPNILWLIAPPANDPLAQNSAPWVIFDIIENGSVVAIFCFLLFLNRKDAGQQRKKVYLLLAAASIACYLLLWVLYFNGLIHPYGLVGMAIGPALYYTFLSIYQRNYIALGTCVLFAFTHISLTMYNYI